MRCRIACFLLPLAIALAGGAARAGTPAYLEFEGAIGVDPLTAAGGVDVLNTVRGINPGGRAWVIRKFSASIGADAMVSARGRGLLLSSGEGITTRATVSHVALTLTCGAANETATRLSTGPFPLDTAGNFTIRGPLTADGVNAAVLPPECANPMLLVRSANPTTGVLGGWFAAGILDDGED